MKEGHDLDSLDSAPANAAAPGTLGVGLVLLLSSAPLVFLPAGYDAWNLPQSALVQVGAVALFLLWLVQVRSNGRCYVPPFPFGRPLVAFLTWSALSLLWARNRYEGTLVWIHWAACALVLVLVAGRAREPRTLRPLLLGLFSAGLLVSLLGAAQRLWGVAWVPQAFPPAATFGNKNVAAQFVLMTLPLGVAFALESRRAGTACLYAIGSALMGGYLLYTLTRSAWLALAVEGGLVAIWARRPRAPAPVRGTRATTAVVAAAVLAALVVQAPAGFVGEAYDRLTAPWRSPTPASSTASPVPPPAAVASVQGRIAIWRNTLAMVRDFPFVGVGLGNHAVYYPAYARAAVPDPLFSTRAQLDYAHNEYLQAWAELGIVGLGLMLWLGATVAAMLWRAYQDDAAATAPYTSMAAAAALVGIGVDAVFSFPFHRAMPPLVAAAFLGLLAAGAGERSLAPPGWLTRLGLVAAGFALLASVWFEGRWIRADRHVQRMHEAEARREWPAVLAEAEAAGRDNPHAREPRFSRGMAYLALGEPRRAAAAFEEILPTYPNDLNTLANLALAYAQAQEHAKALDAQRRALALAPDEALFHFRAASLLEALGDANGALAEHRLAARCEPTSRWYQYRWGVAAMQCRSFAEAEKALGNALSLDPQSASTHKALGVLLVQALGRRREGVEHLRKALALDPEIKDRERIRQTVEAYDKEQVSAKTR